jgi:tetratricopeptide (TPR) repeat protein
VTGAPARTALVEGGPDVRRWPDMGITRERGPVGRGKVFRRRRKKRNAALPDPERAAAPPTGDGYVFDDVRLEAYAPKVDRGGMWSMVRGLFSGGRKDADKRDGDKPPLRQLESASVAPGDDPVRRILALPKGPARLDAFAETLLQLTAGSHAQRAVALAFHRELTTMAEKAQVDLSLLPERVEACAEALVAAGEGERAGQLLAKIGRRQRAAELFVAAGAIDDLEEMHLHIDLEGGGKKQQAKLCYERFEAFYVVGRRAEALDALHEAAKLWPDNPVYQEIKKTFESRVLHGRRATFTSGTTTIDVEARWPVVVGRGEDASVRLKSPLVSRAHVSIAADGARLVAYDLDDRRAAKVDDQPVLGGHPLDDRGTIEMVGVAVRYQATPDALTLWAELQPAHKTIVVRGKDVVVPAASGAPAFRMRFDAHGRAEALPTPGASVGDEPLDRPMLLLAGDKISGPGFLWHAAGA